MQNNHSIEKVSPLSPAERTQLQAEEAKIARGLETFVEVGEALLTIRDAGLYRETHDTFEDYCRKRWGIQRAHAYRLIDATQVVQNLSPIGDIPTSESQVRPLTKLEPAEQRATWAEATKKNRRRPTAKEVQQTVELREDRVKRHRRRVELNGIAELVNAGDDGLVPWARLEFIASHCPKSAQLEKLHEEIAKAKYKATKVASKIKTAKEAAKVKPPPPKEPKGPSLLDRQRQMHAQFANSRLPELTREQVDPDFKGDVHAFTREYGHVQLQTKAERDAERAESACSNWIGALKVVEKELNALLALPPFPAEALSKWIARGDPAKRRAQLLARFDLLAKAARSVEQYYDLALKDG